MPNRLAAATSPYLLQHADNPVDWWEWSRAAFAEARRRDVPILLSVGYSACHWCHVMAHESFSDAEVADAVNAHTVPVKVDREERPDIDAVYLQAAVAMSGQGGWPLTAFLDTDGRPFLAATYFPKARFLDLVQAVAEAWATRRDAIAQQGDALLAALDAGAAPPGEVPLTGEVLDEAARRLRRDADAVRGGFGRAPKFPPSMVLEFLLRHHARTGAAPDLEMVAATCTAMAGGGLHDQLAGGFARYCVDADWVVPHFEKMLYDNAQLLRVYLRWWRDTGADLGRRVATSTAEFVLRDLGTSDGGFASALDADTAGEEGLTYVWTPAQLIEVLGDDDGRWAAELLSVTDEGTFERGTSVLQLRRDPCRTPDEQRWEQCRTRLLAARNHRPQPARDDKVVTAWNGLAIGALAEAGQLLDRPEWVAAARRAADLLLAVHLVDGRLRRASSAGRASTAAGVLEDYGCLADGLLTLAQVTGEPRYLDAARRLLDVVSARFADGSGGFHDTADDAEPLISRPGDPSDNATPSGLSAAAGALVTLTALTGDSSYREVAVTALARVGGLAREQPRFAGWACAVGEAVLAGPAEIAIVGSGSRASALRGAAWAASAPGKVVVCGEPDAPGWPLLAGRQLVGGAPTGYVCRGFTCRLPVTEPSDLLDQLG